MQINNKTAISLLFHLLLLFTVAQAHAFTLSGTIFSGGTPLANANVLLNDAGSGAQLNSTTSDASGLYSFTVNDGSYNLTIQASGYADSVVNGIPVAGADVTQNVVLVSQAFN